MHALPVILSSAFLAAGLGIASSSMLGSHQDASPQPFLNPQEEQQAKLEKELEGTWMLTDYQAPNKLFEGADALKGWIMFRDGYLSWTLYGSEEVPALFGNEREANLEALLFRYRVSPTLDLQMASVLGFSDLAETEGLEFDDGHTALDYELSINERSLTLSNPGVESFSFQRMNKSSFPARAIHALESKSDFDPLDEDR